MPAELTPRQIECLQLAGRGLTDAEIAHVLKVSRKRVSNALGDAYRFLGIHDRRRAAQAAGIRYPGMGIPADELDRIAPDQRRPGGAPVESIEGDRPWLARVWRPLPHSRALILMMIILWAVAYMVIFAGGLSSVATVADLLERLTGRS